MDLRRGRTWGPNCGVDGLCNGADSLTGCNVPSPQAAREKCFSYPGVMHQPCPQPHTTRHLPTTVSSAVAQQGGDFLLLRLSPENGYWVLGIGYWALGIGRQPREDAALPAEARYSRHLLEVHSTSYSCFLSLTPEPMVRIRGSHSERIRRLAGRGPVRETFNTFTALPCRRGLLHMT